MVHVICAKLDFMSCSLQVMSSLFERFHNCEHFLLRGVVILFSRLELSRIKGHRVPFLIIMKLLKDGANGKIGGVRIDFDLSRWIEVD